MSRSRRLLFVSTCPDPWGGSEELWWAAAIALRTAGHRVAVAKTNVAFDHPRVRALVDAGCSVRDLLAPVPARVWSAANAVLPARLELDPDRRIALRLVPELVRRPELAVVSQGSNFDGAIVAHHLRRAGVCSLLVSQKASELHWPYGWVRTAARRAFAESPRPVFVSRANLELTQLQLGMDLPRAVVVDNPVLQAHELPWPYADGVLRLASVGRMLLVDKGQDILLRVLARDRWRARPIEVTLYGSGGDERTVEDLRRYLGLDSVKLAGTVDDVADVWRSHHALVMPSRAEGQPLALSEAMTCGRVPIVTPVAANDLVREGVSGFVAAAPSVDAFDDALERAWSRRHNWPSIGAAAARTVTAGADDEPAVLASHVLSVLSQRPPGG